MGNKILAIDADGVLLDYNVAYARAWEVAFGYYPKVRTPGATNVYEYWEIPVLAGPELRHLQSFFDDDFWSTIPPMPGAAVSCTALLDAGFELVCVTGLLECFKGARVENLRLHGIPIRDVYTADTTTRSHPNPKLNTLLALTPLAFVDDHEPYFYDVPATMHRALITNQVHSQPPGFADSTHADLPTFTQWWLNDCAGRGS